MVASAVSMNSDNIKKIISYFILINFLSLVLVGASIVSAQLPGQQQPPGPGQQQPGKIWSVPNPLKAENFEELIYNIANFIFILVIPLAVIIIIWSGILFMYAGGNEEKIKKAKQTFFWAIIGLTIALIGTGFISLIKDILGMR